MPVALSQIRDLLLPGLWGISGKYAMIERQWPKIFRTTTSEMALERRAAMRYLGLAELKNKGAPTSFDNSAGQRYVYNAEHFEIGLGYAITRKAIDDNLYKSEFGPSNDGLMESFKETEEIYAANVFNTATTYNAQIGGDGVVLLSSAGHPIDPPYSAIANQVAVSTCPALSRSSGLALTVSRLHVLMWSGLPSMPAIRLIMADGIRGPAAE